MLSYEAQLILLGAFVGGLFPLLGILLKDQIDARRRRIEREEEEERKREKLAKVSKAYLQKKGVLRTPDNVYYFPDEDPPE